MSDNKNKPGIFLRNILTKTPELSSYLSKPGLYKKYKNAEEGTNFLVPSSAILSELKNLSDEKKYKEVNRNLLNMQFKDNKTAFGETINYKVSKNKLQFSSGETASLVNNNDGFYLWQLQNDKLPHTTKSNNTTIGKFENKEVNKEEQDKLINIIYKKLKNNEGFKQVVCELFFTLDDEQKEIALCLIHGNPYAELFLLFDSPFITININKFMEYTCTSSYEDILKICGDYLCSNSDSDKLKTLKTHLKESNFMENHYEDFYRIIAENNGKYILNDEVYNICHSAIAEHLYTIEMFCFCMKKLGEEYESTEDKNSVLKKMLDINLLTNVKSVQNVIFEDSENPIVKFEDFKSNFKKFGLMLCTGGDAEKIEMNTVKNKLKNRKTQKYKKYKTQKKK